MKRTVSSKRRLVLVCGFLAAFLVVFNISTYALYVRAKDYLDAELGERLRSIAVTLSRAVEATNKGSLEVGTIDPTLYTLLHTVKAENLLSNIVVLTPEGKTVADLANVSIVGETNPFIELDLSAVTLARSGLSAFTDLYKSGDIYMKSAYAPISSTEYDVVGIIGVEAGAAYFDVLRALSNAILLVDATSVIVIVVLGFLFYRQSLSLDRAQAAVLRGENLATMGRMVAGIAHEIRNPLSIIKTSAERLQKKSHSNDEVLSYISVEVDKLNGILTGYLNFAKAGILERRPCSLQKIVRRCLMILESDMENKSLKITKNFPSKDVMIYGDDKRIQQAVLNILLNAIQAVPEGGRIIVSLDVHSKHAAICIKDTGKGIPPKILKDVTKPFFTTKEHGSGLGLSIVSTIVEEHNGSLDLKSTPGSGTEVLMTLPLASKS